VINALTIDINVLKMDKKGEELKGIDGWLLLPTINFFILAGLWLFNLIVWGLVWFTNKEENNALAIFLISGVLAFLTIYSLVLEFKHKKQFTRFIIITMWATVVAEMFLMTLTEEFSGASSLGFAIIWTWYFNVSKRVKNTFVK